MEPSRRYLHPPALLHPPSRVTNARRHLTPPVSSVRTVVTLTIHAPTVAQTKHRMSVCALIATNPCPPVAFHVETRRLWAPNSVRTAEALKPTLHHEVPTVQEPHGNLIRPGMRMVWTCHSCEYGTRRVRRNRNRPVEATSTSPSGRRNCSTGGASKQKQRHK